VNTGTWIVAVVAGGAGTAAAVLGWPEPGSVALPAVAVDTAAKTPLALPPAPATAHAAAPRIGLDFRDGRLAVAVRDAPLRDVLAAITRSAGVAFVDAEDAGERLSIEAGPAPVRQVLSALLERAHYGYAFVDDARLGHDGAPARVILLRQDLAARPAAPRPAAPVPALQAEAPLDPAAQQQRRVVDTMLQACHDQGCDSS
jgi:hypothetical protein